jgi:hypothetical protein
LLGFAEQKYFEAATVKQLTRERRAAQRAAEDNDPTLRTNRLECEVALLRRQLAQQAAANGTAAAGRG